ncbi:STY4528 family pathogenicity island replication protein [Collimonas silvisoli]|uniref:STY4528 family pathogenicity island replication protein n=1 Tax=Collimonas silvisoli TaxID=2825884 RepID=UPI001B8CF599|nr:STY4528 family pathogenicity island replication protein [Collimonas silvisoli]
MTDVRRGNRPVSLGDLFDEALAHIPAPSPILPQADGFIFSGNRHDSVPRALLLDKRLTPLDRNAWQVFRLLLNDDGITAFPTYEQLAPWLTSMPCTARASHETVARTLTLLRLTRWISLVRRRRDPVTGRIQGNLYVLHDEPLTLYEAIQLDQDYLGLVSHALAHASKSIQRVGVHTLKEMSEDRQLSGKALPSRLQILTHHLSSQGWPRNESYPQTNAEHVSEEGQNASLRKRGQPASESEASEKPRKTDALRNPKTDSTVRNRTDLKEIRTVPQVRESLSLPARFIGLKAEQQAGALTALQPVDPTLHQAILDEWNARCHENVVRNPAGYLFGIIQKALRGEFQPWAGRRTSSPSDAQTSEQEPRRPTSPEVAQAHIARLRSLLRL